MKFPLQEPKEEIIIKFVLETKESQVQYKNLYYFLSVLKQRIVNFLKWFKKVYYLCNMELSITPEFILAVAVLLGAVKEIISECKGLDK